MEIRGLIERIAQSWPAYYAKENLDSSDLAYDLVVKQFPAALQPLVAEYDTITIQGSTGVGDITTAPWIALFDRRLTTSATTGYYVVYLFAVDFSTVTLCLAFGTTQFKAQFGGPAKAFPRMRRAAERLQEMFNHLIPETMIRGPVNLAANRGQQRHYAYQQAAILSYAPYPIDALPEESKLVSDLREITRIYPAIVSDPLDATVERLIEAVVEPAPLVQTISVHDFKPRPPRKDRESSGAAKRRRRYSPESRKVGDAGERVVMRLERKRLVERGRQDLADRVRCHAQEREFVGWDITSFDDDGNEVFIEVKSSVGRVISCVDLTVNEWKAACSLTHRDRYYIYLVTDALSATPSVERLRNPACYVDEGQLSCSAIVYELQLSPTK